MTNDATIVSRVGQCAGGYGLSIMTLTGTRKNGPKNGLRASGRGSHQIPGRRQQLRGRVFGAGWPARAHRSMPLKDW